MLLSLTTIICRNCVGVDDDHVLRNYHYRDDALALWDAIEDYVGDVVERYYEGDEVRSLCLLRQQQTS